MRENSMKVLILLLAFPLCPSLAQLPSSHFYAVQTHLGQVERTDIDSVQMEKMLDAVQRGGMTSIRDECWWSEVENVRGVFTFPRSVDRLIRATARRGMSVLMILNYNNPLYAPGAGAPVVTADNRHAFARYCREVVRRYSPLGVKYYEIWNEPNVRTFWGPRPNASEYTQLLKIAYPAIKQVDPTVVVVAGATSPADFRPPKPGFIPWLQYLTTMIAEGGGIFMDGVSFHLYRADREPESYFADDIRNLRAIVGKDCRLWITEVGYPTSTVWPNISEEKQADYVARLYLLGRTIPQLDHLSYYDLRDDGTRPDDNEQNFGLLRYDLRPKQAFAAIRSVTAFVGTRVFNGMARVGSAYVLRFGDSGRRTVAVWSSGASISLPVNTGIVNQVVYERDGRPVFCSIGDSTVQMRATQQPKYIVQLTDVPRLREMRFSRHRIRLNRGGTFRLSISGRGCVSHPDAATTTDTSAVHFRIHPRALRWEFKGRGGWMNREGLFIANDPGNGMLIGSYGDISDTLAVTIVGDAKRLSVPRPK